MIDLLCSGPRHAAHSDEPDAQDVLGKAEFQVSGMVCSACARLDFADPTDSVVE